LIVQLLLFLTWRIVLYIEESKAHRFDTCFFLIGRPVRPRCIVHRPRDGPTQVPRSRTTSRTSWSRDSPRSEPESDRDSMRFDSGLNLMEPELHNFASTFLFRVYKLITNFDKIPYFTAVLVHTWDMVIYSSKLNARNCKDTV
jgi:hypothetical protein